MKGKVLVTFVLLVILGAAIVVGVTYGFNNVPEFKQLFSASTAETIGNVAPESEETLARRGEFTAKISMWIFIFITILQMAALWIGYAVISNIRNGKGGTHCELDGHHISYVGNFANWCRHWRLDRKWKAKDEQTKMH